MTEYEAWRKKAEFRDFIADHIVPIAIGGPEFDLDNIQLLCSKCDKEKTKRDMGKIAQVRKRAKLIGNHGQPLDAHF